MTPVAASTRLLDLERSILPPQPQMTPLPSISLMSENHLPLLGFLPHQQVSPDRTPDEKLTQGEPWSPASPTLSATSTASSPAAANTTRSRQSSFSGGSPGAVSSSSKTTKRRNWTYFTHKIKGTLIGATSQGAHPPSPPPQSQVTTTTTSQDPQPQSLMFVLEQGREPSLEPRARPPKRKAAAGEYTPLDVDINDDHGSDDVHNPFSKLFNSPDALQFRREVLTANRDWTQLEQETKRRLVYFWRDPEGGDYSFHCSETKPATIKSTVVSCIYWDKVDDYFFTSVDSLQLCEFLSGQRYTSEQKNRIRRNLEGFQPITVSRNKLQHEELFHLIMGFPKPRPRNIEKDIKVFQWKVLSLATIKIISRFVSTHCHQRTLTTLSLTPIVFFLSSFVLFSGQGCRHPERGGHATTRWCQRSAAQPPPPLPRRGEGPRGR